MVDEPDLFRYVRNVPSRPVLAHLAAFANVAMLRPSVLADAKKPSAGIGSDGQGNRAP
jgi:hypothetical protein